MRKALSEEIDLEDWAVDPAERLRTRAPARRLPWLRLALTSSGIVAVLALLAPDPARRPDDDLTASLDPPVAPLAPPPAWTSVARPAPAVALDAPELTGLPQSYSARRHISGVREDSLVVGGFAGEGAYLSLTLLRPGGAALPEGRLFVDLARRAALEGVALVRMSQPESLVTKLGVMEVATAVLEGTASRDCLAFRLVRTEPALRLEGWSCLPPARPATPAGLACLIDRLRRVGTADDPALFAVFREAETRRLSKCTAPRVAGTAGAVR